MEHYRSQSLDSQVEIVKIKITLIAGKKLRILADYSCTRIRQRINGMAYSVN